ncbi:addiction module antidote protein [Rhodopila globiformis]|uniref:Putative addiction module antidote protein n=1 Tax=Rhodopila globiformis TaxID=1071 RepID=A0A2S6NP20_RHOGL|nr:addiction module antidote protein [Rhodopila globiformis]PPQ39547.1 putative addiction module antidote protein [Rhodopila globiformis]
MANSNLSRFDAADYLDSPEARAEYLSAALETGDMPFILDAIAVVARAEGMARVAEVAKVGRTSLYKTLQPGANPEFETILRVFDALGLRMSAQPANTARDHDNKAALAC